MCSAKGCFMIMKQLLRLEEFTMLLAGIYFYSLLGYSWWLFILLLLTPDIGMIGYVVNSKTGAVLYNFFHHKSVGLVVLGLGIILASSIVQLIGIIMFCHACMDRMLGYGLKYSDSFGHTHLGIIKW